MSWPPTQNWTPKLAHAAVIAGALLSSALGCGSGRKQDGLPRLVVLGVDGMDARLTRQYLAEGRLPHLAHLAQTGSFIDLQTSNPPQSPVAWSHFITGHPSESHGIYDFVHRDPVALAPYLSTSRVEEPTFSIRVGRWRVPLGAPKMKLLRDGEPFWERLAAAGIPASVLKIPAHFPPSPSGEVQTLSGMGTPDLLGTYGTFQILTDDPALVGRDLPGGIVNRLSFEGRSGAGALTGPAHPFLAETTPLTLAVRLAVNGDHTAVLVRLGEEARLLRLGEWSDWIPVSFDPGALVPSVSGMVRLLLKSLAPHTLIYVSPINIDPAAPAMRISWPPELAEAIAAEVGRFYTQGMPEDTKALEAGVLSDDEFLAQARIVFEEEHALLRWQLERFSGGLLFSYISIVDQVSHMFFRALDPDADAETRRHAEVIPELYRRIDDVVGEVRAAVGPETTLLVMSDHGFAPYRHKVNLNTWLLQRGYLSVHESPGQGALGHIDWEHTQAYALGLNQLFINLRGREAEGIVSAQERPVVVERIARELESWIDPGSGGRVVTRAYRAPAGVHPDRTPDLIVGFARGYRSSDESATGIPEPETVAPNRSKWSGDHCIDPAEVPGVLFSSRPGLQGPASLVDLAPTILDVFGLDAAPGAQGRALLRNGSQERRDP
jgi:predicted AlkP superfamily phosphohydrolase/phosphomutase